MSQQRSSSARSSNVRWTGYGASREARRRLNGHKSGVLWLTGLPGSGKSTLALALELRLLEEGYQVFVLDGDNLRHGLNADLGFSQADRGENIRRVGEVAALFAQAGVIAICAFISPYRADRQRARDAAGVNFHEIYVRAEQATCERRDPKGHYRRARLGEIKDFTGVSAPYEPPAECELIVETDREPVDRSLDRLLGYVRRRFPKRP